MQTMAPQVENASNGDVDEGQVMVAVGGLQNMAWAADTSKFGYKMLVKMGWSAGKGVGKDLQGSATHVKIARRSENLGVGCSLKQAEMQGWSNTATSFADVLKTLNKSYGDKSNSVEDSDSDASESSAKRKKKAKKEKKEKKRAKKAKKAASSSSTSEKKVKTTISRRIVYHKRLRNKNAKGYDAQDMSAILAQWLHQFCVKWCVVWSSVVAEQSSKKQAAMSASVFVRNLPYDVTQEELERVFGEIGPVKKVDVIKDKGKKKSDTMTRGFAFVRFAVASDAALAIEKLNRTELQGRKMLIDIAKEKGNRQGNSAVNIPKPADQPVDATTFAESEVVTTHKAETQTILKDKTKKKKDEQQALVAKKDEEMEEEKLQENKPSTAKPNKSSSAAVSATPTAVTADDHVQSERNARRRMHREFLRQVKQRKEDMASTEDKSIIIYGIGADVTQKHMMKKAKKIGKVVKTELKEEEKTGKKIAVVQFEKLDDVETAIKKLDHHIFKGAMLKVQCLAKAKCESVKENEGLRLIVRNLAFQTTDEDLKKLFEVHGPLFEAQVVRMPVDDSEKAENPAAVGKSRGFGFVQYRDVNDAKQAVEKLNGVKVKGREMIVDFALSKAKYLEQQKGSHHPENAELVNAALDAEETDADMENDGDDDENQLEMMSDNEEKDSEDDAEEEDDSDDDDESVRGNHAPLVDTEEQRNRTLFIRNLSFQTTEEGLKAFFTSFGSVEYARVVVDKGSGLSKGVGFVRFKEQSTADRVLAAGKAAVDREEERKSKAKNKRQKMENAFTLSALADGDALTLDGRMLVLTRAVDKDNATRLAEANSAERKKKDKRNMYLAYEGTINVNKMSEEQLELPKLDIDKRRRAIREKKEKLKNPMYFVSPVRLSVRNIATSVDDKTLKELFWEGATAGMKDKNVDRSEVKMELLPKHDQVPVKVKMAKIVRESSETVRMGKEPRSRGYGFVEFSEHVHALAALRKLNNNPLYTKYAAGGGASAKGKNDSEKSRLIVEFALENHGKLKLREKRKQDAEKKREEERALREAQGKVAVVEKKSRGQRQREKKKKLAVEGEKQDDQTMNPPKKMQKAPTVTTQPEKKRKHTANVTDEFGFSKGNDAGSGGARKKTKKNSGGSSKADKPLSRKERKQAMELAKEESFDALVRSYRKEIFGEKMSGASAEAEHKSERWFE